MLLIYKGIIIKLNFFATVATVATVAKNEVVRAVLISPGEKVGVQGIRLAAP